MAVVIGAIISLFIIAMYGAMSKKYPAMSLVEINDTVFGKVLGKLASLLYIFYFFSLSFFNMQDMSAFVNFILPNTPVVIILAVFAAVACYAVKKGAVTITSCGALFTIIAVSVILINNLLLIGDIDPENLLPAFTKPLKNYFAGVHFMTALPFCEIFAFYMMVPYMDKPFELSKALRGGLLFGAVVVLMIVLRDITVLGRVLDILTMPSFAVIRLIDLGEILTRVEIVYAIILITVLFMKISVLIFAAVTGVNRLMGFGSYGFLVKILGVLVIIFALSSFESGIEHSEWTTRAAPTYSTFFLVVLPAITLITGSIRKLSKKTGNDLKGT